MSAKKTNGKVGYLHIPDMGRAGMDEFTRLYFPQIHKKALIVDVRGNGGGNVSPIIIERLRRALVMVEIARNGVPQTNPPQTFIGPMVALWMNIPLPTGIFSRTGSRRWALVN